MRSILQKTGPATLVLLSVQPPNKLPTTKRLKKIFGCESVAVYKRPGWFDREIDNLSCIHAGKGVLAKISHQTVEKTTHVLVLPYGPCEKLQAMLTLTDILVCGFTVDEQALSELEDLIHVKWVAMVIQGSMESATQMLEHAKLLTEKFGIRDETVDAALERHLANLDPDFGSGAAAHWLERESEWRSKHAWRDHRD